MRITFVQGDYSRSPRGGPRIVYQYANGLAARGHEVTVVHPRKVPIRPPTLILRIRRKIGEKRDLIYTPKMKWQHLHEKVRMLYVSDLSPENIPDGDAVFATAWHTAPCVLDYPKQKGEKFYLIQHYETWAGPKEAVDATWRSKLHKIVVAEWLAELGKELGCTDISYVPNGIDHDLYTVRTPPADRPARVSFVYSPSSWKGTEDALKALTLARESGARFEAVCFYTMRRPRSLPGWISYVRKPSTKFIVEDLYNRSSIYLCASWSEGFGLAPAEAMACGCALVTTDCAGNRAYAIDGVTALVSEPKQPRRLAENLIRLLNNDALRTQIADNGRERIREFDLDRSTSLLEKVINERLGVRK